MTIGCLEILGFAFGHRILYRSLGTVRTGNITEPAFHSAGHSARRGGRGYALYQITEIGHERVIYS